MLGHPPALPLPVEKRTYGLPAASTGTAWPTCVQRP
jgi:hypothetical protein